MDRQTGRQIDRQSDTQTYIQTDQQTDVQSTVPTTHAHSKANLFFCKIIVCYGKQDTLV